MVTLTRRGFLASSTAGALVLACGTGHAARAFRLGAQSYSFREFSTEDAIKNLRELGLTEMEFCFAHFPPDVNDPKYLAAKAAIDAAKISVPAYGVEEFTADEAVNRKKFEFAKALGVEVLTANPDQESFASLDKLVEEFQIRIAIHNHGPKARYDKVADTLKAVEGHSPLIGACVDTGHVIRSGEKPHEVVQQLGNRVISLHLKDWVHEGKEQIIGKGDLDVIKLAEALGALNFQGPIMLEYEESPKNPVPDMKQGIENWNKAVSAAKLPARRKRDE
ncbi:MAG: sugar phosphate isomerase/epimerase [Candidatus Hydrogenedentes bacterium]|nr:sugar phosphate isomerase/epimerase [Candidatus Hydrogenedentota bacterium]